MRPELATAQLEAIIKAIEAIPLELTPEQQAIETALTRDLDATGARMFESVRAGCSQEQFIADLCDFVTRHRRAALDALTIRLRSEHY